MKTTRQQASARLFKKLSALRATLSNEERDILDNLIVVEEVSAHKMASKAVAKAANKADATNSLLIEQYKRFWHLMIYPANIAIQAAKRVQEAEIAEGWKKVKKTLDVLDVMQKEGFQQVSRTQVPGSALPYVTESGKEFYHGSKELPNDLYPIRISAAFCLLPDDLDEDASDKDFILTKEDLREIGTSIGHAGYRRYVLYTNYGVELHSDEKPEDFGIDIITKICQE